MTTIDNFFESFRAAENIVYQKVEKQYFNGQFYSPLLIYKLAFDYNCGKFILDYEIRVTLFNQPMVALGSQGDRHLCSLQCCFAPANSIGEFEIEKRGLLQMLFDRQPDRYPVIKSDDQELHLSLSANATLNNLYKEVERFSEFSPSLTGKSDQGASNSYRITVLFGAKQFHSDALHLAIDFCKSMVAENAAASEDA